MNEHEALLNLESAIRHALLAPTFGNAHTADIRAALKQLDDTRNTSRAAGTPPTERADGSNQKGV